jgi:hypothetical protein
MRNFTLFISVLVTTFFYSCKEDNSVANLLDTVHSAMMKQDSLMKSAHDKLNLKHIEWQTEYAKLNGGKLDSAQMKLEKAHAELLDKHDDIIDKHELILKMHLKLIEKYKNGNFDKDFIEEEHRLLEEEHELMQMDHDKLLSDHEKLERDHDSLLASLTVQSVK